MTWLIAFVVLGLLILGAAILVYTMPYLRSRQGGRRQTAANNQAGANVPARPAMPQPTVLRAITRLGLAVIIGWVLVASVKEIAKTPAPIPDKVGEMTVAVGKESVTVKLPPTNKEIFITNLTPKINTYIFSSLPRKGWDDKVLITGEPDQLLPSINISAVRFVADEEGAQIKVIYRYR